MARGGRRGFLGTNAGVFTRGRACMVGEARTTAESTRYERIIGLDVRNTDQVAELVRAVNPDVVLHTAASSGHETSANGPEQAYAVNVVATGAIARACAEVDTRIVHISTDAVFFGATGNYSGDDLPEPFSYYGQMKLAGEARQLLVRDTTDRTIWLCDTFSGMTRPMNDIEAGSGESAASLTARTEVEHWAGARKAVDEYFVARGLRPYMHPIDFSGRVFVKTR